MAIVETKQVCKHYGTALNKVRALQDINITVEEGEYVAIVGTSGSGKSTLLNLLGGLDVPSEGQVKVDGCELSRLSEDELTEFRRRKIGFIFQHYNLLPSLNVYENIVLPLELDDKQMERNELEQMLRMLGISGKQEAMTNQLSGGQQQRVAIARALITRPAILLADEPTGNLDSKSSQDVLELLRSCNRKYNQTLIMITHNPEIAAMADRILRIEDGVITADTVNDVVQV
ncbi:ABC transporter ATP-binding protein [Paenibacillus tepidiphilus]|uniref:ABC transporter ATP-binding protein n=1 Tax=Paenibacillus tepidiphilus TaxID=2608683 RepID=UPI00123A8C36|nr:ABC transporter ATP-binding protein [Paenibacillus tepidiphilus]